MEAQEADCEDIPRRDPPDAKARHQIVIDIVRDEPRFRMDVAGCELQQMKDNEG